MANKKPTSDNDKAGKRRPRKGRTQWQRAQERKKKCRRALTGKQRGA